MPPGALTAPPPTRTPLPGRAPRALRMGVDVGGTSMKWVVLRGEEVVRRGRRATPTLDAEAILDAVAGLVADEPQATSVGLALPAVIDAATGTTLVVPNLAGEWAGRGVADALRARTGLRVTVGNDARAFTQAEWTLGAGRGRSSLVAFTLGTGVGGGLVADGRLVAGPRHRAGELGHLLIDPAGEHCGCGARGCLETYAGARALVREAGRVVAAGGSPALAQAAAITPEAIVDAARAGDPGALGVLERAGTALGRALASLAIAITPEICVVGGGLTAAFDLLHDAIAAPLAQRADITGPIGLVASELGLHAGAIGAALWKEQA